MRHGLLALSLIALCACPQTRGVSTGAAGKPPSWYPDRPCQEADGLSAAPPAGGGYADYAARRARCHKKWTLLIYMMADNDLEPWAYFNLREMEAGAISGAPPTASGPAADVVVQLDGLGPGGLRRLHVFPAGKPLPAGLHELEQGSAAQLASPVVARLEEPAEEEPGAALGRFLAWGARSYPAEHYLVAVWGHGRGWGLAQKDRPPPAPQGADPFLKDNFAGGIGFDWTQRTYLGVPALAGALRQVGKDLGRPVDVYLSDACLMQSAEVAAELQGAAGYIVGSTQIEDFAGTPYGDLLAWLHRSAGSGEAPPASCQGRQDQEACAVASVLPALYERSFQSPPRSQLRRGAQASLTMSTVRGGELSASLLPALARLGQDLSAYVEEDPLSNGADVQCVVGELDRCRVEGTSFLGNYRDIGTFLSSLDRARQATPAGQRLHGSIEGARAALDRAVLSHRQGTEYPKDGFRALSVWLPLTKDEYLRHRDRFTPSALFQYGSKPGAPGPWQAWLERAWP